MVPHEEQNLADARDTDIVVGVDGSPSAEAALRWALAQARRTSGRVRAIAAWEFPAYYGWATAFPYEDLGATTAKVLSGWVQEAFDGDPPDVEVLEVVVPGHPAQVLIDASAHAALLVVGSRGHGAFTGTLLGSVSQHCVQHARCPVVVVRGRS
jgi:nucleotide-binding universal stress UspA family protein